MDERMRRQYLVEARQPSSGSQQQPAVLHFIVFPAQAGLKRANRLLGQPLGFRYHAGNEAATLLYAHSLSGVVRLPEIVGEGLDEMGTLARQHAWLTVLKR